MKKQYTKQWGFMLAPTKYPGIYQMEKGGYVARARVKDPTGKQIEILRALDLATPKEALDWLDEEKTKVKLGSHGPAAKLFSEFAADLLERKLLRREIKSNAGESKWRVSLGHLIGGTKTKGHADVRGLGDFVATEIRAFHVEAWKDSVAPLINAGVYSPVTINGWLTTLRTVSKTIAREYETRDFMLGVDDFDTSMHQTYTEEEPNSLKPEDVPTFLGLLKERWPQHYAMVLLGFVTGLRPSTLRPLRRQGPEADVLWDQARLLVRRSEVNGQVMPMTKTGIRYSVHLPPEVLEVLRWHVDSQLTEIQAGSDLLFPSDIGGFRAGSCLKKPFKDVVDAMGLGYQLTPRGMRRTFQDLARAAQVQDLVTRSISGHATEQMQSHYSTVAPSEQRESLARVFRVIQGGASTTPPVVGGVVGEPSLVVGSSSR